MTRERWTPEQAADWGREQPWRAGVNLLPSTAVNSTEMWQPDTFDLPTLDRELGWAADLGLSAVRVFLQFLVHEADPAGHLRRIKSFLDLAAGHGFVVLPVLLDDCAFAGRQPYLGPQDAPVPGVHNSGWTPSPGHDRVRDPACWPDVRQYVSDVVGAFRDDPRILGWDVYNEPGNMGMGEDSLPLLREVFDWVRSCDPVQPLTAAVWDPRQERINEVLLAESDVLSTHSYRTLDLLAQEVEQLASAGRPVWLTEWLMRLPFDPWPGTGRSLVSTHLPYLQEQGVTCFAWGLVNGRLQTHFPWLSPEGAEEPELWFHDLLRADGSPYDEQEAAMFRTLTKEKS